MSVNELVRTIYDKLRPRPITPRTPPVQFTDERGRTIELRPYREADFDSLFEMYASFDPADRAQGVPPSEETAIREWLVDLLEGPDVVARHRGEVIGHVSFVPDGTGRHELAIFVDQPYQRAGIGSELLAVGIGQAKRAGTEYVWLSVGKSERGLHRFYARAGFTVVNPMGITHRMSRYL